MEIIDETNGDRIQCDAGLVWSMMVMQVLIRWIAKGKKGPRRNEAKSESTPGNILKNRA